MTISFFQVVPSQLSNRFETDCRKDSAGYFNCFLKHRKKNSELAWARKKVTFDIYLCESTDCVDRESASKEQMAKKRVSAIFLL